jgi:hypothetical protein
MIKRFRFLHTVDISLMLKLVSDMQDLLEALDEGLVPNKSDYSHEDLRAYLGSLIRSQRKSLGRTKPGSWSVAPDDEGMDSDARVDFIFRPTYVTTATLSRSLCDYPLIALSLKGYSEALHSGLIFCTYRGLRGHGYEADEGMIDAFRILSLGKVPWLLNHHPDFCPKMKNILDEVAADMKRRLETAETTGVWGEDYSEGFRSALETLRLKNDPDFMKSLSDARSDTEKFGREDLPW